MAPSLPQWRSVGPPSAGGLRHWDRRRCASFAAGSRGMGPWPIMPALTLPAIARGHRPPRSLGMSRRRRDGQPGRWTSSRRWSLLPCLLRPERRPCRQRCLRLRTGQSIATVIAGDSRETAFNNLAIGPLGWLMAIVYSIQWWATLLFALPLYTTRMASQRFVEMRDMFTQTIGALAEAVDKRDPYTAQHSQRVKAIAVDIGRVMRVNDARARGPGVGRPPPRRRQDRRPGRRPAQAGAR